MRYRSKHGDTDKRKQILIIALVLILLITIGISVWALFFRSTTPVLAPDYAPQQVEENAEPIDNDSGGEKLQQQQGGGAVSLTYSKEVSIDLSDKAVYLMIANPQKSNQNLLIQIIVHDSVVVQSGLLVPGCQITKLNLWDSVKLSAGKYDGKIVVYYYQPDSGEKAMLNTEIPLTISVKD